MAFVRVTDPEQASELYESGLLYEEDTSDDLGILPASGWSPATPWDARLRYKGWQFYVHLEEGCTTTMIHTDSSG